MIPPVVYMALGFFGGIASVLVWIMASAIDDAKKDPKNKP
jgi:hypothetical protein